jgi:cysteinyl-tRNA synthetase
VVFDLLVRYLRFLGYGVRYVRNITDIDDKIIKRAGERGVDCQVLTAEYIEAMHRDTQVLNTLTPDVEPRATDFMPQMIQMIEVLIEKGSAYVGDDGDVYYSVETFADYGQLSHQDTDQLRAGARVAANESKRDPLDFVLWKLAKPKEPQWDSPWGKGRPGWHIECSAMVVDLLGQSVDIHGGGLDLQFPHHENEIAQSDVFCGCRCVNTWMHMGHVRVDAEKMSKSLGNFLTIGDVLKDYNPEVLRYFLLASHYRSPVSYSTDSLDNAHAALRRFYAALKYLPAEPSASLTVDADYQARFLGMMNDDFNTPEALAVLFEMVRDINRLVDQGQGEQEAVLTLAYTLKTLGGVLGLFWQEPAAFLQGASDQIDAAEIEALISLRTQARKNKNWAESDRLRDQLKSQGVILEDTAQGTTWHIAQFQVNSDE